MEPQVNKASLALIIPCYNPPKGWAEQVLKSTKEFSKTLHINPVIILVNDGSDKGLSESDISLLRKGFEEFNYIISEENKGKGHALRLGVQTCESELMIYTDIDFPYTIESMTAIYESLAKGSDLATGYRDQSYYENVPWFRRQLSKFVRGLLKYILRLRVSDTQCGLKGFNQKGKAVFLKTTINRFLFDMEFITLASGKNGINVEPVTVHLRPGVEFGRMNPRVLLVETGNFVKVVIKRWFGRI